MSVGEPDVSRFDQHQALHALFDVKRWNEAVTFATKALSSDPNDAWLLAFLAHGQLGAGRPAEALKAADNAVRVAPEWEWAHRLRARALDGLGRGDEALAAAKEAVRLDPQNPRAVEELADQQLARKQLKEAEVTIAELIRLAPEWAESYNKLGNLHLLRKKYDQAESDFREALRLRPDSSAYTNNLALALQGRGKRKEAIEEFRHAATIDPNLPEARENLLASTRNYLLGGALIFVVSVVIRVAYVAGTKNMRAVILPVLVVLVFIVVPAWWLRYWLRKRSLSPMVKTFYDAEGRRARRLAGGLNLARWGGFLGLLAVVLAAFLSNQTLLAYLCAALAIVWLRSAPMILRSVSRWFPR